jgi:hypothetical protein
MTEKYASLSIGDNPLIPTNPDALLTRRATADALTAAGFPVRPATLATRASRGGGPTFRLFGKRPLYRSGDAFDWAISRLSPPASNSSEVWIAKPPSAQTSQD